MQRRHIFPFRWTLFMKVHFPLESVVESDFHSKGQKLNTGLAIWLSRIKSSRGPARWFIERADCTSRFIWIRVNSGFEFVSSTIWIHCPSNSAFTFTFASAWECAIAPTARGTIKHQDNCSMIVPRTTSSWFFRCCARQLFAASRVLLKQGVFRTKQLFPKGCYSSDPYELTEGRSRFQVSISKSRTAVHQSRILTTIAITATYSEMPPLEWRSQIRTGTDLVRVGYWPLREYFFNYFFWIGNRFFNLWRHWHYGATNFCLHIGLFLILQCKSVSIFLF